MIVREKAMKLAEMILPNDKPRWGFVAALIEESYLQWERERKAENRERFKRNTGQC